MLYMKQLVSELEAIHQQIKEGEGSTMTQTEKEIAENFIKAHEMSHELLHHVINNPVPKVKKQFLKAMAWKSYCSMKKAPRWVRCMPVIREVMELLLHKSF